jgi:cysteine desulfurase
MSEVCDLEPYQIVGMGQAFKIGFETLAAENTRIEALRTRLWEGVTDMDEVHLNGSEHQHVPGIVNISFAFVEGESLMMSLRDLAVSSGSACTSASLEPSYVLRALGLNDEMAHSSIRFSIGRYTTEADIDAAISQVRVAVEKLRLLSPLWDMFKAGIDLSTVQWSAH